MSHVELTLFLSKIIGITFVVFAVGILFNLNIYTSIAKRVIENPLLLYMTGTVDLILGMLIIFVHNDWVDNWTVLVTVAGWMLAIRGGVRILCPRFVMAVARTLERRLRWVVAFAAVVIGCYGGALLYFGWVLHT